MSDLDERLLALRGKGKTWIEIGALLGLSPRAASARGFRARGRAVEVTRIGEWTAEENATLLAMAQAKASSIEIATRLGRSLASVAYRRTKMASGWRPNDRSTWKPRRPSGPPVSFWTPERIETLLALLASGIGIEATAKRMGVTYKAIETKISKLRRKGVPVRVVKAPRPPRAHRPCLPQAKPAPSAAPQPETGPALRPTRLSLGFFVFTDARLRTQGDRAQLAVWLDLCQQRAPWTPEQDLALVEGLLSGAPREPVLARAARALGLERQDVVDRFRLLTRPALPPGRTGLDSEGQVVILTALRARAASPRAQEAA